MKKNIIIIIIIYFLFSCSQTNNPNSARGFENTMLKYLNNSHMVLNSKDHESERTEITNYILNQGGVIDREDWSENSFNSYYGSIEFLVPDSKFDFINNYLKNNYDDIEFNVWRKRISQSTESDVNDYNINGEIYSNIYIVFSREKDLGSSFVYGLSLSSSYFINGITYILPFIAFIIPYLIFFLFIYIAFKLIWKKVLEKIEKKKNISKN